MADNYSLTHKVNFKKNTIFSGQRNYPLTEVSFVYVNIVLQGALQRFNQTLKNIRSHCSGCENDWDEGFTCDCLL